MSLFARGLTGGVVGRSTTPTVVEGVDWKSTGALVLASLISTVVEIAQTSGLANLDWHPCSAAAQCATNAVAGRLEQS